MHYKNLNTYKPQKREEIMKQKQLKIIALLLFAFTFTGLQAQESSNSAGGEATGSGGVVSYSVGQAFYNANVGAGGSMYEGVQQPYEISVVTEIEEAKEIELSVSAYPNPTTDYLTLSLGEASTSLSLQVMSYKLYDINGKLLQSQKFTGTETQIDMSNYAPSSYFVKVVNGNQSIKEFKIIKK